MTYFTPDGGEIEVSSAGTDSDGMLLHVVEGALTWRDAYALAGILRRRDAPDADVREVAVAERAGLEWAIYENDEEDS